MGANKGEEKSRKSYGVVPGLVDGGGECEFGGRRVRV